MVSREPSACTDDAAEGESKADADETSPGKWFDRIGADEPSRVATDACRFDAAPV